MVGSMVTPADVARMHAHAATSHAQNPDEPDKLLYTSQAGETEVKATIPLPSDLAARLRAEEAQHNPTPAMMPPRRMGDRPAKFASLDAQDLPVVREYSAGGLVFDEHGRVAIIARHSRSGHLEWCLPKGHIEKGETPQQTAVREVHEETGILGEVVDSIATIDYWFTGTSQRVHKLVHHFALRQIGGELTVDGDPDHEAEDAIWVDFADLDDVLSYPNERKIAWLYARKLNRQA
ncbi:NUDIX hydrolase [Bifidobacterium gallicum]|uniref:DNA mismatch repair protein MutT n=1 Tax=Bifidobacterium gallicum DSM 20093 = LMG 11596 TaxID=561180 RepID=D1NWE8_9BIFI|nr:NUDIX hydrolase [Bifidobacterium gallicum]EFA22434.1 hydrolase, NUDIX family [Bifidobacterium gallicum DSM 20093 = LMG 11596]KFI60123.1 DNA mismatch repair protein MutT [Bifidobacterium gallicum DSM 20093 = LMG 11596]